MNEFIKVSLRADSSNLEKGFAAGEAAVGGFKKTLRGVRAVGQEVDNTLKGIGTRAAAMSAALTAANVANTKSAMDFETAMRNVNSISKEQEDQFRSTSAEVLDLSRKMPQSAKVMAEGLYDIASSGFQGAEGLHILEEAGLAATAGMTNTATASKGIAAVLNAYQLSAGDAADVSDTLFQTVNVGVLTFEDLVQQLGDFLPIGQGVNATFEEQASAMAALTRAGFPAAQAATALTGTMRAFLKPSEAMKEQLQELGFSSGAAAIEELGLQGAIEAVTGAVNDDQAAIAQLFQDTEGLRGVIALTANDGALFSEALGSIANEAARAGATQEAYDEQMRSTSAQIQLMKNNFTAARIEIGQYYLPVIGRVAQVTGTAAGLFGDLPGPVKASVAAFMALAQVGTAIGALLLLKTMRTRLLRRAVTEVTKEYPRWGAAMGRVVGNGRSMIGMTARMSKELLRASGGLRAISAVQTRWGSAVNRTRGPVGSMATGLTRLNTQLTRGNTTGGRFSSTVTRLTTAMTRYSTATSTAGSTTGRWAAAANRAGTAAGRMARGAQAMVRGSRLAAGAVGLGISALVGFKQAAEEGRAAAEDIFADAVGDNDLNTLQGMSSTLETLMGQYEDLGGRVRESNDLAGGIMGGLQSLDPTGLLGDGILKDAAAYGEIIDLMEELDGKIVRTQDVLRLFSHTTGLTQEEGQALADTMGIDLTQGVNEAEIALYRAWKAGTITDEAFQDGIKSAGGLGGEMLTAADAAKNHTTNLSSLGEQLKALRSPISNVTGDTMELTDAQKTLQSALRDVGSATGGWQEALTGKQDAKQDEIDAEIERLERLSDARIEAKEDEVDALKDGSDARKAAQGQLEDLRDRERETLEARREEWQKTAEEIKLTLAEYAAALEEQNSKIVNFQTNMVTVTARLAGMYSDPVAAENITRALATMGEDGVAILASMTTASDEETRRMADAVLKNMELTGDESAVLLDAGLTTAAQVGADGAKRTRDAITHELGLLPQDAADIMQKFGKEIEAGINAILAGTGAEPIDIMSQFKTGGKDGERAGDRESGFGRGGRGFGRRNYGGGFLPEGAGSHFAEMGTGGEWALPVRGDKMRQKELWMRAGRSMGLLPNGLMGFSGGGATTYDQRSTRIEKHAPTTFTGPIHANDPAAILAYADRHKRMAALRGGD